MGRFSGLGSVKTNQGGLYFLVGEHLVDIEEVKFFKAQDQIDTFLVSGAIVATNNEKMVVGSVPAQIVKFKNANHHSTYMGNVKQFAGAVLGIENPDGHNAAITQQDQQTAQQTGVAAQAVANDRFWEEALETMVADAQPVKGIRMRLVCALIDTKNTETSGKQFTKHFWSLPTAEAAPAA